MATANQARKTFELTRAFYKGKAKSTNKMYYATDEAELDTAQRARNDLTNKSLTAMKSAGRSASNYSGKTPYDIGATLYKQNNTFGNCGEMAAVAIYLAIVEVGVPPGEVAMYTCKNTVKGQHFWSFNKSFEHSFAVLGKVESLERYMVDPWGGVVCAAGMYGRLMRAKLEQWTREGKRIWADGDWVEPTNALVVGVLSKFVDFSKVGAMEKGP